MRIKLKLTTDYIYYYLLVLLLVNNWWGDLRVFGGLYQIFKPFVLGLMLFMLFLLMLRERYSFIKLVIIFFLIAFGVYTAYVTDSKWALYSMILIAFVKNRNIEKIVKTIYVCMSVFISISVSIFLFQYIFMPSSLRAYEDFTGVTKYSMTFTGANEAARYWIFWCALFMYVNAGKKITVCKKCMILLFTIFFWICTRSDALILILFIALFKCMENKKGIRKFIEKYAGYCFAVIWIISLIILLFEDSFIYNVVNQFSTGRLLRGILGFQTYGITLLGQSDLKFGQWIDWGENYSVRLVVDNAYYMLMLQYGTVYLVIIAYLFIKSRTHIDYKSACCMIIYSVFALAENNILSPTAIFPVIIAAYFSWQPRKEPSSLYEYIEST